MQTERRVAANPQTKPTDLGRESAENWRLPSTSTIAVANNITHREGSSKKTDMLRSVRKQSGESM